MRTSSRSFNGGEVTPEFFGRIDDPKFQTGLALCRNFVVLPHGPVHNNAGTEFVREVKTSAKRTRLLPFTFSITQTMVLEFGEGYFRFHTQGATLVSGTDPYEVSHPYLESELFNVRFAQSNDVLTLTHPAHPPRELRRLGALTWSLVDINFGTTALPPGGVGATALGGTASNPKNYSYVVTGVKDGQESLQSLVVVATTNLDEAGKSIAVAWTANGSDSYNVYRLEGGVFGFVGLATGTGFTDEGILANVSITPPRSANPFVGPGNYPVAVTYFEQRRGFGGGINRPQTTVLTRSGTEANLNTSLPARDDDALTFRVASLEANSIQHLVPLQELLLLTSSAEWRVTGDPLSPSTIGVKPQSYVGAGPARPQLSNNSLVFAAARGGHVREMGFSNDAGGFVTNDLSLRATHLFDGFQIVDSAQSKAPYPILWFTSTSGLLLGLTYLPEQQIAAWHSHDTDGLYESVCALPEGDEDAEYFVVQRTIAGSQKRYVERRASRRFADPADAFFVDCGARYEGPSVSTLSSGLSHLEGKEVAILGDGAVYPRQTVASGTITIDPPASKIVVGLPIIADFQTLPLAMEIEGYGQGRPKNINEIFVKVEKSSGFLAGPSADKLIENKARRNENLGSPVDPRKGDIALKTMAQWTDEGSLLIRQDQPLPLTILSLSMEVSVAG